MTEAERRKQALRTELLARRCALSADERAAADAGIAALLQRFPAYLTARQVLFYHSTPSEADTHHLMLQAMADGKTVALPCCNPDTHTMDFYTFASTDTLLRSHYGIFEPQRLPEHRVTVFEETLCVVPALAVDAHGNRLGYGGGYYDRFLAAHAGVMAVALCYAALCTAEIPSDVFDVPLPFYITEDALHTTVPTGNMED